MSDDANVVPHDVLGLYPAASFRIVRGRDAGDATLRQARWYFADEIIAVAAPGVPLGGFALGMRAQDDVRHWLRECDGSAPIAHPPLVWIAAPDVLHRMRFADYTLSIVGDDGTRTALSLIAKHPLNRSYFDASSAAFFAGRRVKLRGTRAGDRFVARTLWPEDFALPARPSVDAIDDSRPFDATLRALVREAPRAGAQSPFDVRVLWRRDAGATLRDGFVVALVLNGAQGDDDEAHGGHFAIATGVLDADGAIGDWLVDNFYTLDSESEKAIIGAPVPLDNYLADLNAGQSWYRPSALLVVALRERRAADLVQAAMNRVYAHFYRHQLRYDHASMNCTGISVDTLRTLGIDVRARTPSSRALAPLALPWLLASERSLSRARLAYDYVTEDRTRLLPEVAFEQAGAAIMRLLSQPVTGGGLPAMLAEDAHAIAFVRVPQLPSSRAWGDAPVASVREYRARLPKHRADMVTVPVPPRPFPAELRDADLRAPPWKRSSVAIAFWIAVALVAIAAWIAS